ncbi:MAG: T9SS type A sorting domain-containing protein [candidate division WOR-3 bacterium]
MKKLLFLLPILIYGQVIDTVIPLFDTPRERFLYIPEGNKLYVNLDQSGRLLVLDCSTYAIRKIIQLPPDHFPCSVYPFWHRQGHKIYYTFNIRPRRIAVIDNRTDSIIKWINWPAMTPVVYNSKTDKIYASGNGSIAVIDCETDSIVKIISHPSYHLGVMLWDSIGDKLYTGDWQWGSDRVIVLNCLNDSVIAVINTRVTVPYQAVYHAQRRKLYVAGEEGRTGAVICTKGDTLIKNLYPIYSPWPIEYLIINELADRVYWPSSYHRGELFVVNCETDSIIKTIEPGPSVFDGLRLNHSSNRLYIGSADTAGTGYPYTLLQILDCQNDSIIAKIRFGWGGVGMEYDSIHRKIYIGDIIDSALYVIRDDIAGTEESQRAINAYHQPFEIYPNPGRSVLTIRLSLSVDRSPLNVPNFVLKIFDVSGKLIKTIVTPEDRNKLKVSLKGINPGIYFLEFGKMTQKFLVVK